MITCEIITHEGPYAPADARSLTGGSPSLKFRAPHHTTSMAGMMDEAPRAAGGVLYLDEAANFRRGTVAILAGMLATMEAPPRYVVLDCSPLLPVGLGEHVPETLQARHRARLDAIVSELREAIEAREAQPETYCPVHGGGRFRGGYCNRWGTEGNLGRGPCLEIRLQPEPLPPQCHVGDQA